MGIKSINPTTGEVIDIYNSISDDELEQKIQKGEEAFQSWKQLSMDERGAHMVKIAAKLRENCEEYATLLTTEMGKPIGQSRDEVEKCAWNFEHYGNNAKDYMKSRIIKTDASESYVTYEPLGMILNVMPWNLAFWQVFRMAAPILMAGNTILLKHASNVPKAALAIEKLMLEAGLPQGVYQTLLIGSGKVGSVIDHDLVKGVSLTGSEYAGTQVGQQAGEAIKPVVLELGGSDASLILDDADLNFTCEEVAKSRLGNNGQSCIASKRFIVHEKIYDEFISKIKEIFESYVIGDPMDEETKIGPMVSEGALKELLKQIEDSVNAGAKVLTGGKKHGDTGFFLQPTILVDITKDVPSYSEEIFGPVASVIKVKDDEEAVQVANDTRFGLGASIYTTNMERAKKLIPLIEAGSVFVNGLVKSDPRLPFGGIKKSGVGRELAEEGMKAFSNTKTVWIK